MEKKIVLPKDVRTTGGDLWLLGLQGKKERRGEGRAVVNNTVVAYILKPQTLKNPVHKMLFCCCCCCVSSGAGFMSVLDFRKYIVIHL